MIRWSLLNFILHTLSDRSYKESQGKAACNNCVQIVGTDVKHAVTETFILMGRPYLNRPFWATWHQSYVILADNDHIVNILSCVLAVHLCRLHT